MNKINIKKRVKCKKLQMKVGTEAFFFPEATIPV